MNKVLAIIGKKSIEGFSKTRLEKEIGASNAQKLYQAFLVDFFNKLEKNHLQFAQIYLYVTPESEETIQFFKEYLSENLQNKTRFIFQCEGSLFERLEYLFQEIDKEDRCFVHLTGTDIPDFPFHYIKKNILDNTLYIGE